MLVVDGIPILENEMTIIETLRNELINRGIEKLAVVKKSHGNIQVCCPVHKDGRERKPSCGINLDGSNGTEPGTVHCFTCGYVASFKEFVSDCFGYNDEGAYGKKWLLENFVSVEAEQRKNFTINIGGRCAGRNTAFITEKELDSYRYFHPYMYKRKLTDEIIELFDIGYDRNSDCITFPNRDVYGNCLFVARRSVNTKFFQYPLGVEKPLYGLYELLKFQYNKGGIKEVVVCESMIDALTVWVYGKYAVAMNGLGNELQFKQLRELKCRKLILATDNDDAGQRARIRIRKNVTNKIITEYVLPEGKKDINELTKDEFDNLKEIF